MKEEIWYCDRCGDRIDSPELYDGDLQVREVIDGVNSKRQHLCEPCRDDLNEWWAQ